MDDIVIVGAGIGGLTLALTLHHAGIPCRVYEQLKKIRPVGVGINVLPHATRELSRLGLQDALAAVAVETQESVFYNRFGQLIFREPAGRPAGYDWPQFSIHRADLHSVLLHATTERIGADRIHAGWTCTGTSGGAALFIDTDTSEKLSPQHGAAIVACDGIHSAIRKSFYHDEGEPRYSGVNMWRGVTRWPAFLSGASMVRAGWLATGKMVIYPIRNAIDAEGRQLVNWVAEIETPHHARRDWSRAGRLDDFFNFFADWHFDWLDIPEMIRAADMVLEFPMVDQDPLPRWSFSNITLLGDAAHPMVPRGSNGAGQAILDARALADCLSSIADPVAALAEYQRLRLAPTTNVVLANRKNPPDAILREVFLRTGDQPFGAIEDVISAAELAALSNSYKQVAGFDHAALAAR